MSELLHPLCHNPSVSAYKNGHISVARHQLGHYVGGQEVGGLKGEEREIPYCLSIY